MHSSIFFNCGSTVVLEVKTKNLRGNRFDIGDLVANVNTSTHGVVYDYAYNCGSNREIFYGILWSSGKKTWESFHNIRLSQTGQ